MNFDTWFVNGSPGMNILNGVTLLFAGFTLGSMFTAHRLGYGHNSWLRALSGFFLGTAMGIVVEKLARPFL